MLRPEAVWRRSGRFLVTAEPSRRRVYGRQRRRRRRLERRGHRPWTLWALPHKGSRPYWEPILEPENGSTRTHSGCAKVSHGSSSLSTSTPLPTVCSYRILNIPRGVALLAVSVKKHPPEKQTCGKTTFQSIKSGAGAQFLMLSCMAKVRPKKMLFHRHRSPKLRQVPGRHPLPLMGPKFWEERAGPVRNARADVIPLLF